MAPEILENSTYDEKCDVWSLGLILYEMIEGETAFDYKEDFDNYDYYIWKQNNLSKFTHNDSTSGAVLAQVFWKIKNLQPSFEDIKWEHVSQQCIDIKPLSLFKVNKYE